MVDWSRCICVPTLRSASIQPRKFLTLWKDGPSPAITRDSLGTIHHHASRPLTQHTFTGRTSRFGLNHENCSNRGAQQSWFQTNHFVSIMSRSHSRCSCSRKCSTLLIWPMVPRAFPLSCRRRFAAPSRACFLAEHKLALRGSSNAPTQECIPKLRIGSIAAKAPNQTAAVPQCARVRIIGWSAKYWATMCRPTKKTLEKKIGKSVRCSQRGILPW